MRARLALVVGSWLVPALVGVGPAAALSCQPLSDEAYLASSAAVFSGEVIAYEEVGDPRERGTAVVTFAVDRVFKGKLEPEVKVSSGGPYGERPRAGRFLIYADDYGPRRDLLQSQVVRLDEQLDALRQNQARLNVPPPDPKSGYKQQSAPEEEANRIRFQRQQLERVKIDLTEQLDAGALENVKLAWDPCSGSRALAQTSDSERARPIPASLGKGVAPRGSDTADPPPPTTSFADRLAPWWPAVLGTTLVGPGTWILTRRRRRARAAGDARSTP